VDIYLDLDQKEIGEKMTDKEKQDRDDLVDRVMAKARKLKLQADKEIAEKDKKKND